MTTDPLFDLRDRVAIVTGGSGQLGHVYIAGLVERGMRVASFDLAAAAVPAGARVYDVDITDRVAVERAVDGVVRELGVPQLLINNAGLDSPPDAPADEVGPFEEYPEAAFDAVMDVNVKGTFLTSRAALRGMIRRKRGVVLNIGSLVAVRMMEAPVHYCASKAAIKGLSEALAKEVARYGIRVLCLAPGLLEDGVGRNLPDYRLADYLKHCSLGRLGGLAEVARFAAFLVSDANSYMSGETVVIDGGV